MTTEQRAQRKADLQARYGSHPTAIDLIDRVIECDREIDKSQRGTLKTKVTRAKLRLKLETRRDDLLSQLGEQQPQPDANKTAMERRFPTVAIDVLVGAAQTYLSFIDRLTDAEATRYGDTVLSPRYGVLWFDEFFELLDHHAPVWLKTFMEQCEARETEHDEREIEADWLRQNPIIVAFEILTLTDTECTGRLDNGEIVAFDRSALTITFMNTPIAVGARAYLQDVGLQRVTA